MAKYYIKMDDLKTSGELVQKFAKETIGEKINNLFSLLDSLKWEGPAANLYKENYKQKINKIKILSDMIEVYGKFMVMVSEGYSDINDKMYKEWQELIEKNRILLGLKEEKIEEKI